MKVYTSTFDLAHPNNCRFWAPQHSDFKIGVKIAKDGEDYAGAFSVKAGGEALTSDADKTAGFTTFTVESAGPGVTVYEIDVPGAAQKFYLMQVATTSTVFEVGGLSGGGDVPADVATRSWVNSQISGFITEIPADLSARTFAVKNEAYTVVSAGTGAENDSGVLNVNGTAASLRVGATLTTGSVRINANGTTPSIEGGKGTGPEAAYSLSCDGTGHGVLTLNTTSLNAAELHGMKELSGNVYAKADTLSSSAYGAAPKTTGIQTVYEAAWATLSASADANTFYVVVADPV